MINKISADDDCYEECKTGSHGGKCLEWGVKLDGVREDPLEGEDIWAEII